MTPRLARPSLSREINFWDQYMTKRITPLAQLSDIWSSLVAFCRE